MGEDSKELTEEDFDFSGAFKMSEPLPGAKSEKGRSIWVYKWVNKQRGSYFIIHCSFFKPIQCTDLFDAGIHLPYQYFTSIIVDIFIWFGIELQKFITYM